MLIDVGSSARWVKICVEPTQSGLRAACLLAYRAAPISSGSPGFQRTVGSIAGVEAGTPMSTLAVSSAITTLPAVSIAASAAPECALAWVYAATSAAPLSRARRLSVHWVLVTAFASHAPAERGELAAPAGDVQDRDRLPGHHVPHRDARADPVVERLAPVLRAPDQYRAVRLERRAHAVRAGRALGPAEPGRQVGLGRAGDRGLVAPLGQDPAGGVGDGDDATEVAHLVGHGGGPEPQLGEDDVVLGRVVDLRDGDRSLGEVRVDPVLLPAAMPGDRHLGPDPLDLVLALHELLPRREHGAPARARRYGLEPMYIGHGGEPPLVHPQRPTAVPGPRRSPLVAAGPTSDWALRRASCFVTRPAVSQTGPSPP